MSKIIKKQFKRSIPWFLILLFVSTMVVGTVFNIDIKLKQLLKIEISSPEVNANNDIATTTVIVMNAAPVFSTAPYEIFQSEGSTSTSPVNASSSLSFGGIADDPENNSYYLIICGTSTSATVGAGGGAPSCSGGAINTYCVSGLTADTVAASCTYLSATSTLPEINQWWGFVCDNHPTQADCSLSSQGSGFLTGATSSSPFYLNHRSDTTLIRTSVDNRDPGGTFTVQASSTDSDIYGGDDNIIMQVCATNSWATTTGCGGALLCSATSTSDPSCNFTIPSVKAHGSYQYYAFIKDWHGLGTLNNPYPATTYNVNDVPPLVGNVTLNNGGAITVNIRDATAITVTSSSTVSDQNECNDIVVASSTIKYAAATTSAYICAADDNNCYKTTSCTIYGCVASTATAFILCTTTIQFYAVPTDAGYANNPYKDGTWRSQIAAHDETWYSYGTTTDGVELNTVAGINVSEPLIDYGILRSNFDTGDVNSTTTIQNYGNSPLNSLLSVSDLATGTNPSIRDNYQKWSITPFNYSLGGNPGSSTTPGNANVVCPRPTSMVMISDEVYWGLLIPSGIPSSTYTGKNTFTAAVDDNVAEW